MKTWGENRPASATVTSSTTSREPTPAMKLPIVLLAALAAAASARAQIVYDEQFAAPVGGEWSNTTTSTTPIGARGFLGEFGNTAVTLDLTGLPAHTTATISFDLFVIRTWDGNSFDSPGARENWKLSVGDSGSQAAVLDTTFSNVPGRGQAYPSNFDNVTNNPRFTGAAENLTLGFTHSGNPADSVYNLSFTVAHTSTDFRAIFEGYNLQGLADESWGIDNVQVSVSAVPEPGEYAAVFGLGLVGAAAWRHRARQRACNVPVA